MKKCRLWPLWLLMSSVSATTSFADSSPFATANRTPIVRLLGLPAAEDARYLGPADSSLALRVEHSSLFTVDDEGAEQIFLDGESTSITFAYRKAINNRWVIGAEIPLLSHQSGFMDSFVEGWHRTFGLPNGRREEFPRNQLRYSVQTPTANVQLNNSATGLGDIALLGQYSLSKTSHSHFSAQLRFELPTGQSEDLLGSDSIDTALGLNYYNAQLFSSQNIGFNGNIGIVLPGDSDLLPALQEDAVFYANATLSHRFLRDWLSLKVQLETHTAYFDTDIKSLGSASAQLSFGAGVQLSKRLLMNIGMSEDIAVRTAPDFTLFIGVTYR